MTVAQAYIMAEALAEKLEKTPNKESVVSVMSPDQIKALAEIGDRQRQEKAKANV